MFRACMKAIEDVGIYRLDLCFEIPSTTLIPNTVDKSSDPVNFNWYFISISQDHSGLPEITNSSRCTGKKDCACLQCGTLWEVGNLFLDGKDHILCTSILNCFTVVNSLYRKTLWILDHRWCHQHRPYFSVRKSCSWRQTRVTLVLTNWTTSV